MTLEQLIAQFRVDSGDGVTPYLFSDDSITQWLNEAQEEACIRALLIKDWSTPEVCRISVSDGASMHQPHPSIINITRATFTTDGSDDVSVLHQTDEYELDRAQADWRTKIGVPTCFIHHDTVIRMGGIPPAGVLSLEVNRLPVSPMESEMQSPEIAAIHHRKLVHWALFRAFSIPDSETIDATRAASSEAAFIKAFGLPMDSDARRSHESARPHHIATSWL